MLESGEESLVHSLIYMIAVIGCTIVSDPFTKKTTDISTLTIFSPFHPNGRLPHVRLSLFAKEAKNEKKKKERNARNTTQKWLGEINDRLSSGIRFSINRANRGASFYFNSWLRYQDPLSGERSLIISILIHPRLARLKMIVEWFWMEN